MDKIIKMHNAAQDILLDIYCICQGSDCNL